MSVMSDIDLQYQDLSFEELSRLLVVMFNDSKETTCHILLHVLKNRLENMAYHAN